MGQDKKNDPQAANAPKPSVGSAAPKAGPAPVKSGLNVFGKPGAQVRSGAKAGGYALAQLRNKGGKETKNEPEIEKIEEAVLALPEMHAVQVPNLLHSFFDQIGPRLSLPKTSFEILTAFSNIDVTAEKVAQCLSSNPYYESQFYRVIQSVGKREELPSAEGAVVLLGMQNFRNLIVALQMQRTVHGGHPEWDKEGKLKANPTELVKYALKAEESLAGDKETYADTAYAAGLMFDVYALLAGELAQDKKKVLAYIDKVFAHGMKVAQIAAHLSKNIPECASNKFVFSAGLLHDIGKISLAILDPAYLGMNDTCLKKEIPGTLRNFAEEKAYGVGHSLLGAMSCHYFKLFEPIQKVLMYHHQPYVVKNINKSLYQFCSVISLSNTIANNIKKVDKTSDPIIQIWKGIALRDFKIDARLMIEAASRAM